MIKFKNSLKLKLQITDPEIMKDHSMKWEIRNMNFSVIQDIFGNQTYHFTEKEGYKHFIKWYELLYESKEFQKEYKRGDYDHLFDQHGKRKPLGTT